LGRAKRRSAKLGRGEEDEDDRELVGGWFTILVRTLVKDVRLSLLATRVHDEIKGKLVLGGWFSGSGS